MTNEGQLIEVGSDLLISGPLSNCFIQETVTNPLTQFQDSLNSHIRKHMTAAAKESEKQRPEKWSQLPELPACPSENVFFGLQHDSDINKVLTLLRENGPLSPRDIQRKGRLANATLRDRILERLESESLIKVEGKSVQATTFTDFTKALYQNPKFPAPSSYWEFLKEKASS